MYYELALCKKSVCESPAPRSENLLGTVSMAHKYLRSQQSSYRYLMQLTSLTNVHDSLPDAINSQSALMQLTVCFVHCATDPMKLKVKRKSTWCSWRPLRAPPHPPSLSRILCALSQEISINVRGTRYANFHQQKHVAVVDIKGGKKKTCRYTVR